MVNSLRPNIDFPHRCRFVTLGAHVLHVGHKPRGVNPYPDLRMPLREERLVKQCDRCHRFVVKVRQFLVYGDRARGVATPWQRVAPSREG